MIAAIYARRSNEQKGVAVEAKSVTRQIESARAFAVKNGWSVADEHIFVDDGISGAEFERRPGFMALMKALKPRPPFQVLIISERKSIGRESWEANYTIKQLSTAGVDVVEYFHGRSLVPKGSRDKMMAGFESGADEAHREQTSERMWDAHKRLATKGYVTGARAFGYRNQDVLQGTDEHGRPLRSHVIRVIEPTEAAIVRRIFVECASGKGVKAIAKLLNDEGVLSPRPRHDRPRAWAPSSVRCVLYQDLYRGLHIWNKRKQADAWGRAVCTKRPESEWIRTEVPQLRIVSDEEWAAAHRRLDAARQTYLRSANGQLWGRPPSDIESKYLLSGMMRCACCGASMIVRSTTQGRGRRPSYICASYHDRGQAVCANGLRLPMTEADDAILSKLADYVLDPAIVEGAVVDAIEELRPSRDVIEARRASLLSELHRVEEEQARYAAAIAIAGEVEALAHALRDRERQRTRLKHELQTLDAAERFSAFDVKRVERDLRKRLGEWRGLLKRQKPIARQIVSRLLDGRIAWTPRKEEQSYEFAGRVKYDQLLSGMLFTVGMVPVRGFEPRSRG